MAEDALIKHSGVVEFRFHAVLIGLLRNPQIDEAYGRMNESICLVRLDNRHRQSSVTVTQVMQEDVTILDALCAHDTAVIVIEDHLRRELHCAIGL